MSKSNETTPNVPTLRFREFIESWTLIPIKKLLRFQNGINADSTKYGKGIKYISVSDILNNQYITYDCIKGLIDIDEKTLNRFIVEYGDILFQRSSETFEDIGRANVYLDKEHSATFGGFVIRGKKISDYNPLFFRYLLCTHNARKQTVRMGAGAQHYNIGQEGLEKICLYFPCLQEQQKISDLLFAIDNKIAVQNKIISKYETLIKGIRERVVSGSWQWKKLDELIQEGVVRLNRGNIIPKHQKDNTYKYPVYSSSTQNNGLMGYNNTYMFDKELITWSIDGGGNFFYRKKHKFNVTNVCGIMQVDENVYSYRFIAEMLTYQHSKMKFDYQSKAHPSVISSLYSLPCLPILEQNSYCQLFVALDRKMQIEQYGLNKLKEQKKYLLSKMFI